MKGGEADRFAGYKRGRRANFRAQRKQARKGKIQQKRRKIEARTWRWDLCSLTENIFAGFLLFGMKTKYIFAGFLFWKEKI